MVKKLARIPGDKRFTRVGFTPSQKQENEKTTFLKKNFLKKKLLYKSEI